VRVLALIAAVVLAGCAGQPPAGTEERALALRGIMRDMGHDLTAITDGLSREDYYAIERSARRLATHPQPPAEERVRIITWLGANAAARFKGYDDEVHAHAEALAAAARGRQPRPALEAFSRLQSACMGCHVEFRKPLLERFYPL
jgi:cytochrome c556